MILSSSLRSALAASIDQHPAAGVLAFGLQADGARLLEQREGAVPEVQAQDVALVGEQVVADVRGAPWWRGGSPRCARRRSAASRAVSLPPSSIACSVSACSFLLRGVGGVEVADPRVEVPAVVVERGARPAPRPRPASSSRGAGSRPPRPPPARRCRRCSSGRPTSRPRWRSTRTNVSPRTALRRWPMWAALLGLMLVCSTITRPGAGAGPAARPARACSSRATRAARQEEVHVAAAGHLRLAHARRAPPSSAASRSAISRGLRRSVLARSKGAVRARSPSSGRGRVLEGHGAQRDVEGGLDGRAHRRPTGFSGCRGSSGRRRNYSVRLRGPDGQVRWQVVSICERRRAAARPSATIAR